MKKVLILNSISKDKVHAVLYFEDTKNGISCFLNVFNTKAGDKFELVLTDEEGETHFETFYEDSRFFIITETFDIKGEIFGELYINEEKLLVGSTEPMSNLNMVDDEIGNCECHHQENRSEIADLSQQYQCSGNETFDEYINNMASKVASENKAKSKIDTSEMQQENYNNNNKTENENDRRFVNQEQAQNETMQKQERANQSNEKIGEKSIIEEAKRYIEMIKNIQKAESEMDAKKLEADYVFGKQQKKGYEEKKTQGADGCSWYDKDNSAESDSENNCGKTEVSGKHLADNKIVAQTNTNCQGNQLDKLCKDRMRSDIHNTQSNEDKTQSCIDKAQSAVNFCRSNTYAKNDFDVLADGMSVLHKRGIFYHQIEKYFEKLFAVGEHEVILSNKFNNAEFKKIWIDDKVYLLGKIYYGATELDNFDRLSPQKYLPKVIAIGEPIFRKNIHKSEYGRYARYIPANTFDDFGFEILFSCPITGKAL